MKMEVTLSNEQANELGKELIKLGWAPPRKEPEMVELKGGKYRFDVEGCVMSWNTQIDARVSGTERSTQNLAERAAERMVRSNRLEALSLQIDPDYEGWVESHNNYYIYKHGNTWLYNLNTTHWHPERVHMAKETAKTICDLLNSKRFVL